MKNKFIYSPTKSLFEKKLAAGQIGESSIVFIEDTKEIGNRGHYFGMVGSGSGIDPEVLSGIETAIATLQSDKADKSELSDYALKSELPSLDGYLTKTVADGLYATIAQYNAIDQTVGNIQTELLNKVTKDELSTGLAGKLDNSAADGFVPTTRKVNGVALDKDITITATDPNAATKTELNDVNNDLQTFKDNVALTYATDQDVADVVANNISDLASRVSTVETKLDDLAYVYPTSVSIIGETTLTNNSTYVYKLEVAPNNVTSGGYTEWKLSGSNASDYALSDKSIYSCVLTTSSIIYHGTVNLTASIYRLSDNVLITSNTVMLSSFSPLGAPNGIYIQTIDNKLYPASSWNLDNSQANGVAVITSSASFVIAKEDVSTSTLMWAETLSLYTVSGVTTTSDINIAKTDYSGAQNSAYLNSSNYPAGYACYNYVFPNGKRGYLPGFGELQLVYDNKGTIDSVMVLIGGSAFKDASYWSSTQYDKYGSWGLSLSSGGAGYQYNKDRDTYYVRAFSVL